MIFKRKSFHFFKNVGNAHLSATELQEIEAYFYDLKPLVEGINVKIKFVKESTTCKIGQEYCVLFYSEKKEGYLQNIGYLGEKLDLYFAAKNIGACWYGLGKVDEKEYEGLDFVIMMAIKKIDDPLKFRQDLSKVKRKDLNEFWKGDNYKEIGEVSRYAPSAVNTQPWEVETSANEIKVYRLPYKGIMPKASITYYNQVDIGIYLCVLEVCMDENKISYDREIKIVKDGNRYLTAIYQIK